MPVNICKSGGKPGIILLFVIAKIHLVHICFTMFYALLYIQMLDEAVDAIRA